MEELKKWNKVSKETLRDYPFCPDRDSLVLNLLNLNAIAEIAIKTEKKVGAIRASRISWVYLKKDTETIIEKRIVAPTHSKQHAKFIDFLRRLSTQK